MTWQRRARYIIALVGLAFAVFVGRVVHLVEARREVVHERARDLGMESATVRVQRAEKLAQRHARDERVHDEGAVVVRSEIDRDEHGAALRATRLRASLDESRASALVRREARREERERRERSVAVAHEIRISGFVGG